LILLGFVKQGVTEMHHEEQMMRKCVQYIDGETSTYWKLKRAKMGRKEGRKEGSSLTLSRRYTL
jgi:alpha-L-arabinofuranosidase